jgi:hypothetical protein
MSFKLLDSDIIDKLYKKYGFLDDEGYLIGTSDPKFLAVQNRIDQLARRKKKLTKEEEREAAELVIINKSYMKELRDYVLDEGIAEEDDIDDDDIDDDDIDDDEEEDDDYTPSSEVVSESLGDEDSN